MQNEGAKLGRRRPDRFEFGIVEILARDVRADLHAVEAERAHGMAKLVGRELRRLHRQRRDREEAVGMRLHQLGELLVLDAREARRHRGRLRIDEGLRTDREHLHVDLRCRHVLQAAVEIPAAAREVPVDAAGDVERAELLVDLGEFRRDLGSLPLQQPDGLFGQHMGVNVDRLRGHSPLLVNATAMRRWKLPDERLKE